MDSEDDESLLNLENRDESGNKSKANVNLVELNYDNKYIQNFEANLCRNKYIYTPLENKLLKVSCEEQLVDLDNEEESDTKNTEN